MKPVDYETWRGHPYRQKKTLDKELKEEIMSTEPITSFDGEYRFLSNFWPCKIKALGFEMVII